MSENQETPEVVVEEPAERKPAGLVTLAAVLLATLAGGGFVGAKALGPSVGSALAERAEAAPKKKKDGGGHGGGEADASSLHVVDNLVVNPASSGGSRFLLTSLALETGSPEDAATLEAHDLEIRDAFIMVLGTKTVEELTDMSQRPRINRELLAAVQKLVVEVTIHRILIPQFVIQ
jgi:flagellar FliL protein